MPATTARAPVAAPPATPAPTVAHVTAPPHPPAHPALPTQTAPTPTPAATPQVAGKPGFITIDSSPVYATITIDGKGFGETPLIHISLPAGKHYVRATSPSGATHNVVVTIEAGKVAPAARIEW
jgi:hypothetical protein